MEKLSIVGNEPMGNNPFGLFGLGKVVELSGFDRTEIRHIIDTLSGQTLFGEMATEERLSQRLSQKLSYQAITEETLARERFWRNTLFGEALTLGTLSGKFCGGKFCGGSFSGDKPCGERPSPRRSDQALPTETLQAETLSGEQLIIKISKKPLPLLKQAQKRPISNQRSDTSQDRMWTVLRYKSQHEGCFTIVDVMTLAEVKRENARWYIKRLRRAGYLRPSRPRGHGVTWTLIKDPGPRRPHLEASKKKRTKPCIFVPPGLMEADREE